MDTMTAEAAHRRIDELVDQLQSVIDWADRDDRDYALRTLLRDTPTVAAEDPRWRAAEFILALDQRRVDRETVAYDAGDNPQVLAIHTALIDFITKLDDAALEAATGQRFTDTDDPARDVRIAATSLGTATGAWLDLGELE
jgi:hypothetical protein